VEKYVRPRKAADDDVMRCRKDEIRTMDN